MATQFQIKKGLSTNLFDDFGNLKITPIEGCWYLTTDTAELYVCFDGSTLTPLVNDTTETFTPEVQVNTFNNLPQRGSENVVYIVIDENATYRWDTYAGYICIGRDYNEIKVIHGGSAS